MRIFDHFRSDLAIDLGTVNTLVGIPGEGIVVEEPTVVAVEKATGRVLSGGGAVGVMAKQMEGRTPESIHVVRPMRDGVITDFRLCEAMLRHFLRKARRPGWRLRPRVLVGVPGCITPVEKRAVFNSLLRAGAGKVWILPEAMAAAVGAGLPIAEPVASMICDIGGGTTEIAVISLGETVSGESIRTGRRRDGQGRRRLSQAAFQPPHQPADGRTAADRNRQRVSARRKKKRPKSADWMPSRACPEKRPSPARKSARRSASRWKKSSKPSATRSTVAAPDLAADLVTGGLVLCGGGSLLRRLDRYFHEHTGLPVRLAAEPLTTVVQGLLICLEQFDRWRPLLESSDDDV